MGSHTCPLSRPECIGFILNTEISSRESQTFENKRSVCCFYEQSTHAAVFSPACSASPADMECGGGELSDSGSSGYWSWDHGNVSPAPSPSVPEVDSSPDEGLHMELDQGDELSAKKPKVRRREFILGCFFFFGLVLSDLTSVLLHPHGVPSLLSLPPSLPSSSRARSEGCTSVCGPAAARC